MTKMQDLKVDAKFRDLIPRLTDEEFAQLEKNILEDGEIREPIIAWNGIIIDGHHRHEIWMKYESLDLPYRVDDWHFESEQQAMQWACDNQLGRRNLPDEQMRYLRGKQHELEKGSHGGDRKSEEAKSKSENHTLKSGDSAQELADKYGVSRDTIIRDEKYAKGIDIIGDIAPETRDSIMHGKMKVPRKIIEFLPRLEPERQEAAVKAITEGDIETAKAAVEAVAKKPKWSDEEIIGNLYGDKEKVVFSGDNAVEELRGLIDNFQRQIEGHLEMHFDLLDEANRKKISQMFTEVQETIEAIQTQYGL